jgi:hypothetical protein
VKHPTINNTAKAPIIVRFMIFLLFDFFVCVNTAVPLRTSALPQWQAFDRCAGHGPKAKN